VPLSKVLFDSTIELHLDMEMVAIQSRATIVKLLQNLEKELIAKVADGVSDWSKARIAKQLSEADAVIRRYYDDAAGIARDTTTSVAQVSASATTDSLLMSVGNQVAMAAIPTASYLETLAGNTIIQGATQSAWWSRQSEDTAFKFQSAVRQGLVGAETTPQIVKRVRGVLDISKRNAETLVHTSVQSVANTTREKVMQDNSDVVAANEYSSALDRKTCLVCGSLDGLRWKNVTNKPIGHSVPYSPPTRHFRCRCSMVPVLKTWKELGINMDELPDGTRASMEGQVTDKTFEDWLKRKTESDPTFADRTLGKGRAELWRNNKITMDQMISGGKPLSLSELKAKYDIKNKLTLNDYIALGKTKADSIINAVGSGELEFRTELNRLLNKEIGTDISANIINYGSRNAASKLVVEASKLIPNSWTKAIDDFGSLTVRESTNRAYAVTFNQDYTGRKVDFKKWGFGVQEGSNNAGFIVTNKGNLSTALHELSHRVQSALPNLDAIFQDLHKRRTNGDKLKRLTDVYPNRGFRSTEVCKEDHYINAYFGKEYSGQALEVMTMSIESVMTKKDVFNELLSKDRELFDLVIGLLFHYAP
jgi:SPP1 gp7 family putative phage head morphogenesis protein